MGVLVLPLDVFFFGGVVCTSFSFLFSAFFFFKLVFFLVFSFNSNPDQDVSLLVALWIEYQKSPNYKFRGRGRKEDQ